MVFTNIKIPRSEFPQKGTEFYTKTLVKKSAYNFEKFSEQAVMEGPFSPQVLGSSLWANFLVFKLSGLS